MSDPIQLKVQADNFGVNLQLPMLGVMLLWIGVIVTALGVVYTTHLHRQLVHQLEVEKRQTGELQVTWGRYLLEQSTWAAYNRVERIAVEKLDMQIPDTETIVVVSD